MKLSILLSMLLLAQGIFAKSLGTIGQTFPVLEKSLLTLIHERLTTFRDNGTLKNLENEWVKRVEDKAVRPAPLSLTRCKKKYTHFYVPVATLDRDIKGATGRVILSRGMSVNALTSLPGYQPVWVFLNYDDEAQRHYAGRILARNQTVKWILTGGNVREAERQLKQPVFFDQEGRITQKLGILHVPAMVTRVNDTLKILELAIGEDGHAY